MLTPEIPLSDVKTIEDCDRELALIRDKLFALDQQLTAAADPARRRPDQDYGWHCRAHAARKYTTRRLNDLERLRGQLVRAERVRQHEERKSAAAAAAGQDAVDALRFVHHARAVLPRPLYLEIWALVAAERAVKAHQPSEVTDVPQEDDGR